jgi:hypothetical protein
MFAIEFRPNDSVLPTVVTKPELRPYLGQNGDWRDRSRVLLATVVKKGKSCGCAPEPRIDPPEEGEISLLEQRKDAAAIKSIDLCMENT